MLNGIFIDGISIFLFPFSVKLYSRKEIQSLKQVWSICIGSIKTMPYPHSSRKIKDINKDTHTDTQTHFSQKEYLVSTNI